MPYHTAAFTALIDNTANNDVPALKDDILAISNDHFLPQRDWQLIGIWAGSATLSRARFVSPSNRQVTIPFIRPISQTLLPPTDPNFADYSRNPFRLRALEEFALEATSGIAMGTERFTGIFFIATQLIPMPVGDIFTFRGTSTTAVTANEWTTITMTFADILPQGNYAIVGMEHQSSNGIAARLILEDQTERPGTISITSLANRTAPPFYKGRWGMWGRFRSTRLPIVQVLANGADASHEIYLDIIRLAA